MRPKRKTIQRRVKNIVLAKQNNCCSGCGIAFVEGNRVEFDHRPAIIMRAVNVEGTDYFPPQLDPDFIDALHKACHLRRTVGRLLGAEKTVTTKGSDAWLAAKFRKIEGKNKPKRKSTIPSRPFPKSSRKLGK